MPLTLPDLPYANDALEPHIDARTMEIHHDKHHAGYVTKANNALEGTPLENETCPWTVCSKIGSLPADKQTPVRNNAGGVANHALFWMTMGPGKGGAPSGDLGAAIDKAFGGYDDFKKQFTDAATGRFGSGWAWLYADESGALKVGSTANQDNPAMGKEIAGIAGMPLLGLDVWEHAYYLKYQNKRPEYVDAFWNVVDWDAVSDHAKKMNVT